MAWPRARALFSRNTLFWMVTGLPNYIPSLVSESINSKAGRNEEKEEAKSEVTNKN